MCIRDRDITVINRSDSVVTVYMPEIPPPPPIERVGFDCYGIFRSDTLELGTFYKVYPALHYHLSKKHL